MAVVEELIRTEADGGISFGNYELDTKTKVSDFEYEGDLYKVKTFKEITKLERNGLFVYESVPVSYTHLKAYSSAVGAGAFVSEIFGEEADELRRRGGDGGEFGATTGRPRRMGWFDCVASKYGCRLQGTTDVAFTVLDVLGYLDEIPVCVGYEIDGQVTTDFPVTHLLEKAKPVLKLSLIHI